MIWGAKAVKRISKRNLGSQMFWFEMSLLLIGRITVSVKS